MTKSEELIALADNLEAWAPLVASGYEVPAAATTMTNAAYALRSLASQAWLAEHDAALAPAQAEQAKYDPNAFNPVREYPGTYGAQS